MTTSLRYPKGYQFFDSNGNPLALGNLYYYVAGTTTLQDTYSDSAGSVPNTNPIVLDASGRLDVDVYLGSAANYKEVLTTSSVTLAPWPDDNIQCASQPDWNATSGPSQILNKPTLAAVATSGSYTDLKNAPAVFTGDSGSGGTSGLVPAPAAGAALANEFLKADGTWSVPPSGSGSGSTNLSATETASSVSIASSSGSGATIPAATSTSAGVLDSARAAKIDGLAAVATTGAYSSLSGLPTIPAAQVNSDWNASSGVAEILNKPTLGTAAAYSVPATGNASSSQVVTGADTRLADARTPLAHAATHASGGSDPVSIAASQVTGLSGAYAPLTSPALTGTPTAPTATAGTNSTQIATTAYLDSKLAANSGIATLDGGGKLAAAQIPASLVGAAVYQGTWNASTNTPALASGVGTKGNYYKVATAGATLIDGNASWNVGDTIIFDGTTWDKIDGITNEVVAVAGLYGSISAPALKSALAIGTSDVSGLGALATQSIVNLATQTTGSLPAASVAGLAAVAATGAYSSLSGTPSAFTGASSSAAGSAGLVPAPAAGQQNDVLSGAGAWVAQTTGVSFSGATSGASGSSGLVPAPAAGQQAAWLRGDGTWQPQSALGIAASQVSGLATVATTGAYSSLSGTPTIPAAQVNSDWNATSGVAQILNKPFTPTTQNGVAGQSFSNKFISIPPWASEDGVSYGDAQLLYADGGFFGSQKTLTGSPTASTTSGSQAITLSTGHPFVNGDFVQIAGMPRQGILSNVTTTGATITPAAGATVTNAAITYIAYDDPTVACGYNPDHQYSATEPEWVCHWEADYLDNDGYRKNEFYVQHMFNGDTTPKRPIFAQVNRDLNAISEVYVDGGYNGFVIQGGPGTPGGDVTQAKFKIVSGVQQVQFADNTTVWETNFPTRLKNFNVVSANSVTARLGTQAGRCFSMSIDDTNLAAQFYASDYSNGGAAMPIWLAPSGGGVLIGQSTYNYGALTVGGNISTTGTYGYRVANVQVVGPQITGYGTPTGGSHQASFSASTITLANLAACVAQLIVDLKTHGLLGA